MFGESTFPTLPSPLGQVLASKLIMDCVPNFFIVYNTYNKFHIFLTSCLPMICINVSAVPYFERLPVQDRVSMVGLLVATVDW